MSPETYKEYLQAANDSEQNRKNIVMAAALDRDISLEEFYRLVSTLTKGEA